MSKKKLTMEVLVSTMNQVDHSLIEKMKIQSDAIIINQCNRFNYEEIKIDDNSIRIYSFHEKGVGLSRNNALMRSKADICLFADDDVSYVDGYKEEVLNAFEDNPEADIIVFNVLSTNSDRPEYVIKKKRRVRFHNCMRYGTFRIAAKVDRIKSNNIYFSLLFGGGAKFGSGEDTLFLVESLKKGLKIYSSPIIIGNVTHNDSTWFNGYNEKFFKDKAALFNSISKTFSDILMLQFLIRKRKMFGTKSSVIKMYRIMKLWNK